MTCSSRRSRQTASSARTISILTGIHRNKYIRFITQSVTFILHFSLLSRLAVPDISDQIPGWTIQGSVYHQYIKLEAAVNSVLEAGDDTSLQYQLERLRPAVSRLCRAVSSIPVITAKERLAQSEIAKKVKQKT